MNRQRTLSQTFDTPGHALALDGGQTLAPYTVAYQTWGRLNTDRSNAILIFHALSGDSHVSGEHEDGRVGWWDLMVGPGRAFDTDRFFIICANVLGGCKGSTGPGSTNPATGRPYAMEFPVVTIHDMVRAQRPLLDRLGIEKLHAVTGGSMGGMLALAFTQLYPGMAEHAVVLASAHTNHAQAIAWNKIGRRAIMNDPLWREGNYYDSPQGPPRHGLAVARMIGHVTYISEGAMDRKFGRALQTAEKESFTFGVDYSVESYLAYQGEIFHQRFDANSYLYITRAIDYFDFSAKSGGDLIAAFAETRARFHFFSYDADWLYSPERMEAMAVAARAAGRHADHHKIHAPLGHDAFLVQRDPQTELIRKILS
ncbi:MAG: homoserine O-acetyltransferase [Methylacidiphilales bacterium]|nr:homoserine O-acetyltransferase [Candidatus Methylacidiphilales bacterium]